jgi:hypothetical protein
MSLMDKNYLLPERSDSAVEGPFSIKFTLRLLALFAFGPPLIDENPCYCLSVIQVDYTQSTLI